jgi:hypothetical protein
MSSVPAKGANTHARERGEHACASDPAYLRSATRSRLPRLLILSVFEWSSACHCQNGLFSGCQGSSLDPRDSCNEHKMRPFDSTQEADFRVRRPSRTVRINAGTALRIVCTWVHRLLGRAMAQVVNHRPITAEARVRARLNPCGICGGQSGTGTGFSPSSSVFPCQYIFPPNSYQLGNP